MVLIVGMAVKPSELLESRTSTRFFNDHFNLMIAVDLTIRRYAPSYPNENRLPLRFILRPQQLRKREKDPPACR